VIVFRVVSESDKMSLLPDISLALVQMIVFLWDIITLPFYFLLCRPWVRTAAFKQVNVGFLG
jgi:hypothetical protein